MLADDFLWSYPTRPGSAERPLDVWFWKEPIFVGSKCCKLQFPNERELRVFVQSL